MKKQIFLLLAMFGIFKVFAADPIYKEFTINGKTESRWVYEYKVQLFNSNGKKIYDRDGSYKSWYDYDDEGKLIHQKNQDVRVYEYWYTYDSNGNNTYTYNNIGYEYWSNYDSYGNLIFKENSSNQKYWYDYDSNNQLIHSKYTFNSEWYECWYEYKYDNAGNKIYSKEVKKNNSSWDTNYKTTTIWYEYDSNGNVIHRKEEYVSNSTRIVESYFKYDTNNNLVYSRENDVEKNYDYDSNNNLIHEKHSDSTEFWYEYEYDSENRISKITCYKPI